MTQYLLIAIAILVALLAATGALLKSSWETNAQLELQYAAQQAETQKAIEQTVKLRLDHQNQIHAMDNQLKDNRRETAELNKSSKRIQATTSTLEKALEREPSQSGRVITYLNARGMREISAASGSTPEQRKITVPKPAKADTRNSSGSPSGKSGVLAK